MSEILHSYELSPMQAGMLFHSLYHQRTGIYVQQMVATLDHELNVETFLRAWSRWSSATLYFAPAFTGTVMDWRSSGFTLRQGLLVCKRIGRGWRHRNRAPGWPFTWSKTERAGLIWARRR